MNDVLLKEKFVTLNNIDTIINVFLKSDVFARLKEILNEVSVKMEKLFSESFLNSLFLAIKDFEIMEKGWYVRDRNLFEQILKEKEEQKNKVIVKYYTDNKFEKIKQLIKEWETIGGLQERISVIKSTEIFLSKDIKIRDLANVIIPVLTNQLTGMFEDLCGIAQDFKKKKSDKEEDMTRAEFLKFLCRSEFARNALLIQYIIFDKVLLHGDKISRLAKEDILKYYKFRNKISHGDKNFLNYGTDENFVRAWLELDLLIVVYDEFVNKNFQIAV